ncbi:nucleotide exchange factor SIL1 [Scaptodrosophila lebanonensis]|uniref:Nucleotide exchange factor SIL1 n=1 Tax=Drosophila lebanonensis TaxID=7225 RepID=A0A6J2TG20_DROLE|nr:nucleotide exchange factor SIL1 [Scaptodrosophila lebanonensis]
MRFSLFIVTVTVLATITGAVNAGGSGAGPPTENQTIAAEFVATSEWQVVGDDQAIPRGLHVRINLQTGVKEAKLLEEDKRGTQIQSVSNNHDDDNAALAIDYKPDIIEQSLQKAKERKQYMELRKAYKELEKNFRTDGEIIVQLLGQYQNFSKSPIGADSELKAKLKSLENLEYLLHQIDNALVFIDSGGLDIILLPIVVNETNIALRVSAMRVLGALAGNNPKAQIKVFERNFGSHLAQVLMTSSNREELSAAMHAFGTLLRKFPLAQHVLSTSGTQALIGVVRSDNVELRTKAKAVTLISDLVLEKRMVLESNNAQGADASTIAQYMRLEFEPWLQTHGYCTVMETVIAKQFAELIQQPNIVEQFAVALENTAGLCQSVWSQSPLLRHALLTIRNHFAHSEDEYHVEISEIVAKICLKFYGKHKPHSEL